MSHRVNFILDDATWEGLQEIPRGERSRLVNHAVCHELKTFKRRKAVRKIDQMRSTMKPVEGTSESWIRQDRDHH